MKKAVETGGAPGAIGPYSQGIRAGGLVFVSGQIPVDPETGSIPEGIAAQTERCIRNAGAVLDAAGCGLSDVAEVQVFLKDMEDFGGMNDVYAKFFEKPYPARAAVEVSRLPRNVLVEIRMTAVPAA